MQNKACKTNANTNTNTNPKMPFAPRDDDIREGPPTHGKGSAPPPPPLAPQPGQKPLTKVV